MGRSEAVLKIFKLQLLVWEEFGRGDDLAAHALSGNFFCVCFFVLFLFLFLVFFFFLYFFF